MPQTIGDHLLGRVPSPPDEGDAKYRMVDALKLLGDEPPTYQDDVLTKTVQELIDQGYFAKFRYIYMFWRWLKQHLPQYNPVTPTPAPPAPPPDVDQIVWANPYQLDQEDTGHCVGFGWACWGDTDPIEDRFQNADGHAIYYESKSIELGGVAVKPGDPQFENGTYVRAGAKAMQVRSRIANYVWASRTDEITTWVKNHGPVVVGTDWLRRMFYPDQNGLLSVDGSVAGGHCYCIVGWYRQHPTIGAEVYEIQNSWGVDWGVHGRAFIRVSDFQQLLDADGEACAGSELPIPAAA